MEAEETLSTGNLQASESEDSENEPFYTSGSEYTTMQHNFFSVKNCDNCCCYLEDNLESTRIIFDDSQVNDENSELQMFDALAFVYGLSWQEFLQWSKKSPSFAVNSDSVTFCKTCAILLSENYKSHKAFEDLCHSSSIVYRMKEFRNAKTLLEPKLEEAIYEMDESHSREESVVEYNHDESQQPLQQPSTSSEVKFEPEVESLQEESDSLSLTSEIKKRKKIKRKRLGLRKAVAGKKNMKWTGPVRSRRVKVKKLLSKKRKPFTRGMKAGSSRQTKESSQSTFQKKVLLALQNIEDKTHLAKVVVSGRYICPMCGEDFESYAELKKEHWEQEHGDVTICDVCGKCLKTARYLKSHMILVHGRTGENCNNPEDSNKMEIKENNEDGTPKRRVPEALQCEECGKQYASKYTLRLHMLVHTDSSLKCNHCEKTFTYADSLKNHVMREHERPERNMFCDICPMKFYTASDLRKHKKCHVSLREFVCEECGKSFKQIQHLKAHLQCHEDIKVSEERGENAFMCDECGRSFRHSLGLYKHKKHYHRGVHDVKRKVYKCSFCGKVLSNINILTSHENRHKVSQQPESGISAQQINIAQ